MHDAHLEFIIAGVGVGAINFLLGWRRAGLRLGGPLLAFTVATALAGLLGARLYARIEQGRGWGFVLSPEAGLRLPGATIGLLVGLIVFRRVLLPQMIRHAIPSFGNNWLVLLKTTALLSIVGLEDMVRRARLAAGAVHEPFTFYLAVALIYLALTTISVLLLRLAERRYSIGTVR